VNAKLPEGSRQHRQLAAGTRKKAEGSRQHAGRQMAAVSGQQVGSR